MAMCGEHACWLLPPSSFCSVLSTLECPLAAFRKLQCLHSALAALASGKWRVCVWVPEALTDALRRSEGFATYSLPLAACPLPERFWKGDTRLSGRTGSSKHARGGAGLVLGACLCFLCCRTEEGQGGRQSGSVCARRPAGAFQGLQQRARARPRAAVPPSVRGAGPAAVPGVACVLVSVPVQAGKPKRPREGTLSVEGGNQIRRHAPLIALRVAFFQGGKGRCRVREEGFEESGQWSSLERRVAPGGGA